MPTKIYIYGSPGPWRRPAQHGAPQFEIMEELSRFLGASGRIIDDVDDNRGPEWNIDILIHGDRNINLWVTALADFLRNAGVPDGPLLFSIFRLDREKVVEHRRVEVP